MKQLAPFGIKHELAKRYTLFDWFASLPVKKLINFESADDFISELISQDRPGLVARLGGTEARFLGEYLKLKRFTRIGISSKFMARLSPRWKRRSRDVHALSGFYFQDWNEVERFSSEYLRALSCTDILGAWGVAFTWVEGINLDSKKTKVIPVGFTAPWVEPYAPGKTPWSRSLEGKRVLVISGFAESIMSQHANLSKAFAKTEYPVFKLSVIRAPIVTGERDNGGKSWLDLLNDMKNAISKEEFDVALIAAGAFSYPLAAYVKDMGKVGIHCGGGLQLFFAIMGNRWNNSPEVLKYVNEFWVRPSKSETPNNVNEIENACYW